MAIKVTIIYYSGDLICKSIAFILGSLVSPLDGRSIVISNVNQK